MSVRIKLTEMLASEYQVAAGKTQSFVWDLDVPGLGLRCTAGSKSFVFQFQINNRTVRITIGAQTVWKVASARIEARKLRVLVDQGIDPRHVLKDQLARTADRTVKEEWQQTTFRDAWHVYVEANEGRWGSHHRRDHEALSSIPGTILKNGKKAVGGPIAALFGIRLCDISHRKLEEWLIDEVSRRPRVADKAFRLLKAFLRWCKSSDQFRDLVFDLESVQRLRRIVPRMTTKTDSLQREMLPAFFEGASNMTNMLHRSYFQMMLLTGARPGELIELKWSDVDLRWRVITLHDKESSSGVILGTRKIPIGHFSASILKTLMEHRPINQSDCLTASYVFYGRYSGGSRPMSFPNSALSSLMNASALPHLTLHGLRRSYSNVAEWLDWPAGVKAQLMGHKPSGTAERHYTRRPIDLLMEYQQEYERWILVAAKVMGQEALVAS